jgi:hypothetical protein
VVIAGSLLLVTGCVDHDANSAKFCKRNAELLQPAQDDATYTKDQATYYSDQVEKSMRFAEDGTRKVRTTARKLADAYDDVRRAASGDNVPEKELRETYQKLGERRAAMRDVCRSVLST